MEVKQLTDFAEWLWQSDRLHIRTQIEPFETPEMIVEFYLKANVIPSKDMSREKI